MYNPNGRDGSIIVYLMKQGWALSHILAEIFFNSSREACTKRMLTLEKMELVEGFNFYDLYGKSQQIEPACRMFLKLDRHTKIYRLNKRMQRVCDKSWLRFATKKMVMHQALLGPIQVRLSKEFGKLKYLSEVEFAFGVGGGFNTEHPKDMAPDMSFYLGDKNACVELERKSRRGLGIFNGAYEDRIKKLSLFYDRVLYITEKEKDLKGLVKKGGGIRNVGFASFYNLDEVFRENYSPLTLNEFLSQDLSSC